MSTQESQYAYLKGKEEIVNIDEDDGVFYWISQFIYDEELELSKINKFVEDYIYKYEIKKDTRHDRKMFNYKKEIGLIPNDVKFYQFIKS